MGIEPQRVPEGTLVRGVIDWKKKAVYFEGDTGQKCVAYVGHTCFIVTPLNEELVTEGTVVHPQVNQYTHYVINKILQYTVVMKSATTFPDNRKSLSETREKLVKEYFWVRNMDFEEYNGY